ncbi:DNA-formamidopyrimidine glycosylase [Prochlorococcus marinus]|uniref:DNA-formamidopyrimidine glycosylase n=1 Tax=Prochlorococcus marinus TaxID=1219 RepID=UPI001AD9BBBE|nr:DNA-formamidopyrimidine glycosylase [Prochlorococcus marinus]MBO8218538.1 DNA-formamidopyrimidine glycosylase [Prochlorococcus marinus CUG1416]MBW3050946.1 DNA-formamidopyrimidine glycosylase [Prochlorococcus marinus str. MU1416]
MPELPEVETVRRGLEQKLNNFIIKRVEVCRDSTVAFPKNKQEFINGLQNSLLYKWDRRGKYLIAELKKIGNENIQFNLENPSKNNGFLIVHLRMTGYFKFINNSAQPCKHTRIRVFDNINNELRYIDVRSFGQMWWIKEGLSPKKIIKGLGSLGPEPFSKDFDANYLKKVISKRTKSIKAILLDQTIVAGIGNIYADESLYSAGISPFREGKTIKKNELINLKESIVNVLKKSIGSGGTTFSDFRDLEGENGNFGLQTNVYRRTGKECRKCGNLIEKQKIAGRSTHWCPNCQK